MKFNKNILILILFVIIAISFCEEVDTASERYPPLRNKNEIECLVRHKDLDSKLYRKYIDFWYLFDKTSFTSADSGLLFRMFYDSTANNRKFWTPVGKVRDQNAYFLCFRDFDMNQEITATEYYNYYEMLIPMKDQVTIGFRTMKYPKRLRLWDIVQLKEKKNQLIKTISEYFTEFRNLKDKLISSRNNAAGLVELKKSNQVTLQELNIILENKKNEIAIEKENLKNLKEKRIDSMNSIRNIQMNINKIKSVELNPLRMKIENNVNVQNGLQDQIEYNLSKMNGLRKISKDDIQESIIQLKQKMIELQQTYLTSDPKWSQLEAIIGHIDITREKIPYVIYN